MDELKKFSQTVLNAVKNADVNPGSSDSAVNSFARSAFVKSLNDQTAGTGALADQVAKDEAKAAEAERQRKIKEIQDKLDPSKYSAVKDQKDGGYSFYDPSGNKISIAQYSAVTGLDPAKILVNSDNPFDLQYVNDYNNTRDLVTAIQNGDTDTLNKYRATNSNLGKMTPEQLMRELIKKYPHIYGNGNYGQSYTSNNNPLLRYNNGAAASGSSGSGISMSDYGY